MFANLKALTLKTENYSVNSNFFFTKYNLFEDDDKTLHTCHNLSYFKMENFL